MDIRFLAIIFLVAALMEMLAKMMRKAKQREIEDEATPRSVDPLAEVFKELKLVAEDEETPEPARREQEHRAEGRSARREEAGPGTEEPRGEPSEIWALPASPPQERPAGGSLMPLAPSGRVAEPPRPRAGRLFEPEGTEESPMAPVPAPVSPEMKTVPPRDRAPRPVEVRSREFRPREAREIVTHRRTETRPASVAAVPVPAERVPGREGERVRTYGTGGHGVLSLGSVRGLRRLVVAREVLGPPLALRGEEPF